LIRYTDNGLLISISVVHSFSNTPRISGKHFIRHCDKKPGCH